MNLDEIKRTLAYIESAKVEPYSQLALDWMLSETLDPYEIAADFLNASPKTPLGMLEISLVLDILEELGEEGDAQALNDLGVFWLLGRGGRKDLGKAKDYFRKAVFFGSEQAEENLGLCALEDRDYKLAFRCFVKGALLFQPMPYYNLAQMYEKGQYVVENKTQAFEMYYILYHNMDEEGTLLVGPQLALKLAQFLKDGIGTEADPESAIQYCVEAGAMLDSLDEMDEEEERLYHQALLLHKELCQD